MLVVVKTGSRTFARIYTPWRPRDESGKTDPRGNKFSVGASGTREGRWARSSKQNPGGRRAGVGKERKPSSQTRYEDDGGPGQVKCEWAPVRWLMKDGVKVSMAAEEKREGALRRRHGGTRRGVQRKRKANAEWNKKPQQESGSCEGGLHPGHIGRLVQPSAI